MKSNRDPSAFGKSVRAHPVPKWQPPVYKAPGYWTLSRVLGWAASALGLAFMIGAML